MKHQFYENLQSQINVEENYSGFSVSSTKRFCNGKVIAIKPALTALIRSRIWALNKAEEIARSSTFAVGKQVIKISTSSARTISIAGEIVFEQKVGGNDMGCFVGPLSTLTLPTGRSSA